MADTRTPIATEKFLADISDTVESVDKESLATTVDELGQAFAGTGEDLQRIIDTGNSFIKTADDNFDVTTALIRDSNTVLQDAGRLRPARSAPSPSSSASSAARWPAPTRTCAR